MIVSYHNTVAEPLCTPEPFELGLGGALAYGPTFHVFLVEENAHSLVRDRWNLKTKLKSRYRRPIDVGARSQPDIDIGTTHNDASGNIPLLNVPPLQLAISGRILICAFQLYCAAISVAVVAPISAPPTPLQLLLLSSVACNHILLSVLPSGTTPLKLCSVLRPRFSTATSHGSMGDGSLVGRYWCRAWACRRYTTLRRRRGES